MSDVLKVTNIVVILSDIDENFKINRAAVPSRIYTRKIIRVIVSQILFVYFSRILSKG